MKKQFLSVFSVFVFAMSAVVFSVASNAGDRTPELDQACKGQKECSIKDKNGNPVKPRDIDRHNTVDLVFPDGTSIKGVQGPASGNIGDFKGRGVQDALRDRGIQIK